MTSTATQSSPSVTESLVHYARIIRRRFWIVLVAVVLVPIVSFIYANQQPAAYKATASALLNHLNLAASLSGLPQDPTAGTNPDRALATQSAIGRTPAVAEKVIKATHSKFTTDAFLAMSSVTPRSSTDLIDVSVVAATPGLAQTLATAYVHAFADYSNGLERGSLDQSYNDVTARLDKLRADHLTTSTLYSTLRERQQEIVALQTLQTPTLQVVKLPTDAVQVAPRAKRAAAIGLLAGLLLAVVLSLMIEAIDTRIRGIDEIESLLGLPLLARIPPGSRASKNAEGAPIIAPDGPQAEAFRLLRTNLSFLQLGAGFKTLMVTSPESGDGKTTTVANLGAAFARSGADVIVCDLDARKPDLAAALGKPGTIGLTEVALGRATLDEALQSISLGPLPLAIQLEEARSRPRQRPAPGSTVPPVQTPGRLRLLGFGKLRPPLPGEFVGSEVVRQIISALKERADIVIVDSAPMLRVGDSLTVSGNVDAALITVRSTSASRDDLSDLRRLLTASPVNTLGAVATDARVRQTDYGYGFSHPEPASERSASGA